MHVRARKYACDKYAHACLRAYNAYDSYLALDLRRVMLPLVLFPHRCTYITISMCVYNAYDSYLALYLRRVMLPLALFPRASVLVEDGRRPHF